MKFIKAGDKDLTFLFNLRNEAVNASYSKRGKLSLEQIRQDYLNNPKKQVYIVWHNQTAVGYLIFESLGQQALEISLETRFEISVAIMVEHRRLGLGNRLIEQGTGFAVEQLGAAAITARVFTQNSTSLKLFVANGYEIIDDTHQPWRLQYDADNSKQDS